MIAAIQRVHNVVGAGAACNLTLNMPCQIFSDVTVMWATDGELAEQRACRNNTVAWAIVQHCEVCHAREEPKASHQRELGADVVPLLGQWPELRW